jgi:hypothetical protein
VNRRVLVTRPEPGAAATAARLKAMALVPVILPLTSIFALSPPPGSVRCAPARLPSIVERFTKHHRPAQEIASLDEQLLNVAPAVHTQIDFDGRANVELCMILVDDNQVQVVTRHLPTRGGPYKYHHEHVLIVLHAVEERDQPVA